LLDSPANLRGRQGRTLDRVGASFREAGAAEFISVQAGVEEVKLLGPPREHPRRSWLGPEWQALELLRTLPDDAGDDAVWPRSLGRARDEALLALPPDAARLGLPTEHEAHERPQLVVPKLPGRGDEAMEGRGPWRGERSAPPKAGRGDLRV
jgi:hypothetical protein